MADKLAERNRFLEPLRDIFTDDVRDWFIGFDQMVDDLAKKWDQALEKFNNFPASTVERINDTHYRVKLSVPNFEKKDLTVEIVDGDELVVTGQSKSGENSNAKYSSFEQRFLLADEMRVDKAKYTDGTLTIDVSFPEAPRVKGTVVPIE